MTVPDAGEFSLGNGALVHNCDAFRYMAVAWREEEKVSEAYEEMRGIMVGKPSVTLNELWKTARRPNDRI